MTAREFAGSLGPLHVEPAGPHLVESERRRALLRALRGVELGVHDERVVALLARGEPGTVRTVESLLERVRRDGHYEGMRRVAAVVAQVLGEIETTEPGDHAAEPPERGESDA